MLGILAPSHPSLGDISCHIGPHSPHCSHLDLPWQPHLGPWSLSLASPSGTPSLSPQDLAQATSSTLPSLLHTSFPVWASVLSLSVPTDPGCPWSQQQSHYVVVSVHFSLPHPTKGLKDRKCVFGDLESPEQGLEHSRRSLNMQTEEGCFQGSDTEAGTRGNPLRQKFLQWGADLWQMGSWARGQGKRSPWLSVVTGC